MSFQPEHFAVWIEIPVSDMSRAVQYYETVLQTKLKLTEEGPNPMATFVTQDEATGVAGHLYPGNQQPTAKDPVSISPVPEALKRHWNASNRPVAKLCRTLFPSRRGGSFTASIPMATR